MEIAFHKLEKKNTYNLFHLVRSYTIFSPIYFITSPKSYDRTIN